MGACLKVRPAAWLACIKSVGIDPSAAFRKALRENLPDAAVSVDHFPIVQLANDMLTKVRQRVSREQNGRRGLKTDKDWAHRQLLLRGYDRLSAAGKKRLDEVSYRDAFVLLLKWLDSSEGVPPDKVTMAILDPDHIGRFSDWIRQERQCAASTSNARIAAIRSFAKFVQAQATEHIEICRRLLEIPSVKTQKTEEVEFLSVRAVQLVVGAASVN